MRYKSLKILFVFFICLTITVSVTCENVTIKGTAKGAEGKTITIKYYSDYFTLNETFLSKTTVDSAGTFELKCSIPSTVLAVFHIEYYSGEMYLEQNKSYNINIRNLVFNDTLDKVNYNLNPFTCYIRVNSSEKEELNHLTQKLNIMYNSFLKDNIFALKSKHISQKVDTFLIAVKDTFAQTKHVFFNQYLEYRIASLKLMTNYSNSYRLMADYIYQRPILYDNIEYITFLSTYFEDYFQDITSPLQASDLYAPINVNHSLPELMDVLGKDTMLVNEKLRELVMLGALNLFYSSNNFSRKSITGILKQLTISSKFENHRQIAQSMLSYYTRFDKGSPAPDFSLKSSGNTMVHLSDFRGKYVYLNFYTSWCVSCRDEMEMMKKLRQNFDNDVVFISISADREFMNMYHFVHDQKYNWLFLHLNSDYDLMESYAVYAFPDFVLIDREGNFIKCPALKPSENIELILTTLINEDIKSQEEKK